MCSYCKKHDETEVPDPYYGGPQGFEKVMIYSIGFFFPSEEIVLFVRKIYCLSLTFYILVLLEAL